MARVAVLMPRFTLLTPIGSEIGGGGGGGCPVLVFGITKRLYDENH
jgi:hypothetical protein